jgi:hypothetical protein
MAERRKKFIRWLLPKLIVFAIGVAVGYYVRDRQQTDFKDLYEQTLSELEDLRETGEDMIERGRRAGEAMKAAADTAEAAVEEVTGGN